MTKLRVAFQVGSRLDGGMARYAQELGAALAADPAVELVPVGTGSVLDALHDRLGSPRDRIEVPEGRLAEARAMRFTLGRTVEGRADVLHTTKHLVPRESPVPTVLTVHDVLPLDDPGVYTLDKRLLLPRQYRASIREATALAIVSHTTMARLDRQVPGAAARATIIPTVPPPAVVTATPVDVPGAPPRFGLYVGDLSPRKNVGFLLDRWEEVHERTGVPLLLAGSDGWKARPVLRRLPGLAERGVVRRLGFVEDGVLRWLYEHAAVVAFPSRYEGTGLPVVEALDLGAPVVASDEPALVEFSAGRARHLPVADEAGWSAALVEAISVDGRTSAPPSDALVDGAAWASAHVAIYRQLVAS